MENKFYKSKNGNYSYFVGETNIIKFSKKFLHLEKITKFGFDLDKNDLIESTREEFLKDFKSIEYILLNLINE
jgi:hypothetical protein